MRKYLPITIGIAGMLFAGPALGRSLVIRDYNAPEPVITEMDHAIAANPNDVAALSKRGQLLVLRGNFLLAIRDFDELIRLRPRDPVALNNRCWARAILGDLQSALWDCTEALKIRPQYADAFDSRGFVNLKMERLSDAIKDYDRALQINPRQASSLYARGLAKLRESMRDIKAAEHLQSNIAQEFITYGVR